MTPLERANAEHETEVVPVKIHPEAVVCVTPNNVTEMVVELAVNVPAIVTETELPVHAVEHIVTVLTVIEFAESDIATAIPSTVGTPDTVVVIPEPPIDAVAPPTFLRNAVTVFVDAEPVIVSAEISLWPFPCPVVLLPTNPITYA